MKQLFYYAFLSILMSCSSSQNTVSPSSSTSTPTVTTNDLKAYSILSDKINNDYRYINEKLLFVYDEKYNATTLNYKIYSKEGEVVYSNSDNPRTIHYGRNYVSLDFPKTIYRNWGLLNPLLLEVTDSKNQKQYLKFVYSW
ncbi:MAG: hypothetical protein GYB32_05760 [Algicola sp.]|nr:hypothetical protein [Algicola sp.]